MIVRFVIVILSLAGCGRTDCTFEPYLKKFQAEAVAHGRPEFKNADQSILFINSFDKSDTGVVVGKCFISGMSKSIYILRSYWEKASETTREQLIFHELGHCALGRKHEDTHPSIMMSLNLPEDYAQNREYYLNELFH